MKWNLKFGITKKISQYSRPIEIISISNIVTIDEANVTKVNRTYTVESRQCPEESVQMRQQRRPTVLQSCRSVRRQKV